MIRPLGLLVLFLAACAVLAAPAPEPFRSGWGKPEDPDKDCEISRGGSVLIIEMPGTDHDYDPLRKRFNAPRLLREVEGDFDVQVRVRLDCPRSAPSTVEGQPAGVSVGFLLLFPDKDPYGHIGSRLDYGVVQQRVGVRDYSLAPLLPVWQTEDKTRKGLGEDGCILWQNWGLRGKRAGNKEAPREQFQPIRPILYDRGWRNWPLPKMANFAYLRLEQRGEWITCFMSPDGEKWTKLLAHTPSLPAKSKLGLAAYSTSTESSKVRFDQLKFTQVKKER